MYTSLLKQVCGGLEWLGQWVSATPFANWFCWQTSESFERKRCMVKTGKESARHLPPMSGCYICLVPAAGLRDLHGHCGHHLRCIADPSSLWQYPRTLLFKIDSLLFFFSDRFEFLLFKRRTAFFLPDCWRSPESSFKLLGQVVWKHTFCQEYRLTLDQVDRSVLSVKDFFLYIDI